MDPFLRWAGSKRKLLPELAPHWSHGFRRYVEPFMGSAALYFFLEPERALLSDINSDLVNAFTAIRDHPIALHSRLSRLPVGRESYYQIRTTDPANLRSLEAAARFIYLNRFCFNGLYRTNASGEFNVPFSPSKTGALPSKERLFATSRLLKDTEIVTSNYASVLTKRIRKDDFVYLDPPYAVENRRIFKQYGPHVFGRKDLENLAELLPKISSKGARFLLSYAYSKDALNLFKQWTTRRVYVQRNIAGFAKHRRKACELLVTNTT